MRSLAIAVALAWLLPTAAVAVAGAPDPAQWAQSDFEPGEYFDLAEVASWKEFRNRQRVVSWVGLGATLAFYLAFIFGPVGDLVQRGARRLAGWLSRPLRPLAPLGRVAARMFGEDWASSLLFAYGYLTVGVLVQLPLSIWSELQSQQVGLSNYSTGAWIWDLAKSLSIMAFIFSCLVFGLFGLIRRLERKWWLVLGLPAAGFMLAYGVVAPYRARVFHDFEPLDAPALQLRLEKLATREGLELTAIKVVNASRVTTALNAYVTGVGPSRELVLYDTLLDAMTDEEIEVAFAHELGHHRREDVLVRYSLSGLGLLALMFVLSRVLIWGSKRRGHDGPGDVRNLPLMMASVWLIFLVLRPINLAYSRYEERLADRVSFELVRNPDAFISQQVKLARVNKADVRPSAAVVFWYASHPSVYERIATARWYRDWLDGQPVP